jgi:hypothetical protein
VQQSAAWCLEGVFAFEKDYMAKRFGRNQKRKLRELVENHKQAYLREAQLLAHCRSNLEELREQVHEAKKLLGSYSVIFPPQEIATHQIHEIYRFAPPMKVSFESGLYSMETDMMLRSIDLPVMTTFVDIDKMRNQAHFILKTIAGDIGYAVDIRHLERGPRDYAIQHMSRQIAAMLIQNVRGLERHVR